MKYTFKELQDFLKYDRSLCIGTLSTDHAMYPDQMVKMQKRVAMLDEIIERLAEYEGLQK